MAPEERYELTECLGQGGMGQVFRAWDRQLQRPVALKLFTERLPGLDRPLREARAQAQVQHRHVLDVYETGRLDGREYIAMQLVQGRTLQHRAQSASIDGIVQVLAAVADGLHAAHQRGLIHRDVKPSNILIEDDGGTAYVGDFGIALAIEPSAGGGVGLVEGTPAYMAPEALRGDTVDRRSDVYGLGATLYAALAGHPPFGGDSAGMIVEQVLAREPVALRELRPGIPADLEAVVLRCMARDPEQRYASALEAAEDLRRFLAGDVVEAYASNVAHRVSRFVHRHRGALVSGVASMAAAVVTIVSLATVTVEARGTAEVRRGKAEELLSFMIDELRSKLVPVNRLDVLDDVGAQALRYFASVPADEITERELIQHSKALYQIGDIRMRRGRLGEAMEAFQHSLALADALHQRDTEHHGWLFGLGQSHFWVGYVHFRRGDLENAGDSFEHYRDISQRLTQVDPSNHVFQRELAYSLDNLARLAEVRGLFRDAEQMVVQELEILGALRLAKPSELALQAESSRAHTFLGRLRSQLGDLEGARDSFDLGRGLQAELVAMDPENLAWKRGLGNAHSYLAQVHGWLGNHARVESHVLSYETLAGELTDMDPDNMDWRFDHAVARLVRAHHLRRAGQMDESYAVLQDVEPMFLGLLKRDPEAANWRHRHAVLELEWASWHLTMDQPLEALDRGRSAQQVLGALHRAEPNAYLYAADHARAQLLNGRALFALGRSDEARNAWAAGLESQRLLSTDLRWPPLLATLAKLHLHLDGPGVATPWIAELERQGFVDAELRALRLPNLSR